MREVNEAYVISDLHIGGTTGFQMFAAGAQFAELISHILGRMDEIKQTASDSFEVLLVINGDFVDFLAEAPKKYFTTQEADGILESILTQRPEFQEVTKGLQRFVARPGARLVVVLGNHDLELTLPECREKFLQLVTGGVESRRSRVELAFEGWGYRFSVGGQRALCLHGNETDPMNFTRYDELNRIQGDLIMLGESRFAEEWVPSGGTKLVVDAVNPLKKDYPFVDLLHPLIPLVPAVVGLLDYRNIRYVDDAIAMAAVSAKRELTRPASEKRMLSGLEDWWTGAGRGQDTTESIIDDVEFAMRQNRIDDVILQNGDDAALLGFSDWIRAAKDVARRCRDEIGEVYDQAAQKLKDARRTIHCEAMREILSSVVATSMDSPFRLSKEDAGIEARIGYSYEVVLMGHTHHRRFGQRADGREGLFINTGCWADRMTLLKKDVDDATRFRKIYDAFMCGERSALKAPGLQLVRQECPVARISRTTNGAQVTLGAVEMHNGSPQVQFDVPEFTRVLSR
ncbi:MAG: metallophosphoesterase [Planctomycetaceae bacterium]|nr:metallophosphoesterase [Planctomycetaceae bacterium]